MPAVLSYPGVYIEEVPSGVRTITGVATSITAFIGRALRGPLNDPIRVQSFAEFERVFGGLWVESMLGYAVSQFFQNGGGDALVVRVVSPQPQVATATVGGLKLIAANVGAQGNTLKAKIENAADHATNNDLFKLTIVNPPNADIIKDDLLVADVDTALAATPVRRDQSVAAPTPRPGNAVLTDFTQGLDGPSVAALPVDGFTLAAASPGAWGQDLRARIEHLQSPGLTLPQSRLFNLAVRDTKTGATERFLNLSTQPSNPRYAKQLLEQESKLVRINGALPDILSSPSGNPPAGEDPLTASASSTSFGTDDGSDGVAITDNDIVGPGLEGSKQGLWTLEKADLFNLLCIPPFTRGGDIGALTRSKAADYSKKRRAMFLVDPLSAWDEPSDLTAAATGIDSAAFGLARTENAALFFPAIRSPDPLRENRLETFAPCGAVAGVMARTDATRGVWKAPAGIEATLNGVSELSVKLTDGENGQLNPLGINCLRAFPVIGRVVWGARTLRGADQLADQWKYIPVRRLALFLEESLFRGTQWVVFEPNDEPLWAQIRLNIGAFLHNLFRQGAFQGLTPREAYFVKCDKDTTTQNHRDLGIVNIVVGFAPLKPAEFVVIKIQQIAGQIES